MNYNLDQKDNQIFAVLYQDPFQSYNGISKKVNLAPATVKDRILNMKSNGFLRSDQEIIDPIFGKRMQTEVIASYHPPSIGLIRLFVLFEGIPDTQTLKKLLYFCDQHPYTHYRGISYKNPVNLYVQFDIPQSIKSMMETTIKELGSNLGIENTIIILCDSYYHSYPDFSLWSTFKRDWETMSQKPNDFILDILWQNYLYTDDNKKNLPQFRTNPKKKDYSMSLLDAKLLRELTINARVSLKTLSETYNLTTSVLSRYLSKLKEKVINRGKLLYDESFFGLNNSQVIFGKFNKHSDLNANILVDFIDTTEFPLYSNIYYNDENFVIETVASPILSTEMAKFIWQNTNPLYFNVNQIHIPSTHLYYFYPENYVDKNKWNINEDYIRDIPLQTIK